MKKNAKPRKTPVDFGSGTKQVGKEADLSKPVNQTKPPRTGMEPV